MNENSALSLRPWGGFRTLYSEPGVHVKTLHINPGARLSLQRHVHRSETWVLVRGDACASVGMTMTSVRETELEIDRQFFIPQGAIHRLASQDGATIVEISYGNFDENDIERFEDDYGRIS